MTHQIHGSITISNPSTPFQLEQRDALLTMSLRETATTWAYQHEYPLVLNNDNSESSWCLYSGSKVAAHANLWNRCLVHRSSGRSIKIGLVGNVATHPDYRGSGFMSAIFDHLTTVARSNNLEALILWSDLLQFYQKLGFSSIGRECRFVLGRCDKGGAPAISKTAAHDLSDTDLNKMLQIRPKMEWELERSTAEFRTLLAIPNTALFVRRKGPAIASWFAVGKGSDMQGIVHEWGAATPSELIRDIQSVLDTWALTSLTVLSPVTIGRSWLDALRLHSTSQTEHNMALGLPVGNKGQEALSAIARSFLWGFDSI